MLPFCDENGVNFVLRRITDIYVYAGTHIRIPLADGRWGFVNGEIGRVPQKVISI
jgi:hypothetical protein